MMECELSNRCGACSYMGTEYEETLKIKRDQVRRLYPKNNVEPVLGMQNPAHYRHKVYATFRTDRNGKMRAGMFEEDSHKIVPTTNCLIQHETANRIINSICRISEQMGIFAYNEDTHMGVLRHAYVRVSHQSGKVLLVLVIGSKELPGSRHFIQELLKRQPMIETIILNWNHKKTSMIQGEREKVLYGKGYITDTILGKTFRISSRSFYQVNPLQTERLYKTAIDLAKITKEDTVLDACCGIGTISLIASDKAKQVYGVEINPSAIRDAQFNARQNHVTNAVFTCDDAEHYLSVLNEKVDVILLDPPRSGMGRNAMESIRNHAPDRIVYISCNPETQAKDLKVLNKDYTIKKIIPVDMFPMTEHVETVCLLTRRTAE